MQRDRPRKGENKGKEKNLKTFQSSVENGGADTSDHSFSQTCYSEQPLFSDSAFWLIERGSYQSLQLPLASCVFCSAHGDVLGFLKQ